MVAHRCSCCLALPFQCQLYRAIPARVPVWRRASHLHQVKGEGWVSLFLNFGNVLNMGYWLFVGMCADCACIHAFMNVCVQTCTHHTFYMCAGKGIFFLLGTTFSLLIMLSLWGDLLKQSMYKFICMLKTFF